MICSQRYLVRDDSSFANWVLAESLWDILANLISSKGWCRCVKSVINGTNLKAIWYLLEITYQRQILEIWQSGRLRRS